MDDRLQLSIESNTEKLVNSIEMLVSEMKTLKTAVSSTIPSLSSYSKQFNSMNTATKSLKGSMNMVAQEMESMKTKSQQGADSLKSLSKEFRGLGDTQTANYLKQIANNIDEVSKSDARSKVAELSSSLKGIVDESVITKLDKVAMGIKNIKVYGDTKKIADIKLSSDVPSSFDKATVSIKKMNAEIEETNSKGSKFKQTMGSIANSLDQITKFAKISALFYTLKQGLEVINSFIRKSVSFTETLNLFNVAMGNSTDKAQQFINTMSSNFGLDPDTLMRYMGTFNLMADSMGLSEKNAYTLSETMTKLGVDMASLYNIPIEEAMNKLRAGISGETEPLRQLGIDVTEATIRMEAMRQGIDKTTNEMTYAEKSQLRYLAILRQTTSAQGDFARTMNSPANQLKILKEQFALLSREIGNIFIPILNQILPYVIAVVMVLQDMAKAIASFFGFELPKVDYSSIKTGASDVAGAYDEVGDSANNAGKKVKEFQKQLLGVDELNVIQPPSKDSGSSGSGAGAGTSGGGFDLDLPGYDNLMDSVTNKAKELKKQVEPLVKAFLTLGAVLAGLKLASVITKFLLLANGILKGKEATSLFGVAVKGLSRIFKTSSLLTLLTKLTTVLAGVTIGIVGSAGVNDAMKKMTKEAKYSGEEYGKYVASVLSTVGGFALAGSAFGPLGTAIGGLTGAVVAGISAFVGYRQGIEELAKEELFGNLTVSTEQWTAMLNNLNPTLDANYEKITQLATNIASLGESFNSNSMNASNYLYQMSLLGETISEEISPQLQESLTNFFADANKIVEEGTNYSLTLWTNTYAGMTNVTKEEQQNMLNNIIANGEYKKQTIGSTEQKVWEIYNNGIAQRGYLNEQEIAQIQQHLATIKSLTATEVTKSESDLLYLKTQFKNKDFQLTEESYNNLMKALETHENEKRNIIKENYNRAINDANSQYATELQRLIDSGKSKVEAEKIAGANRQKAYDTATKKRNEDEKKLQNDIKKYTDEVTKDLKKKYESIYKDTNSVAKEQKKIIEKIFKGLNVDLSDVKTAGANAGKQMANSFVTGYNTQIANQKLNMPNFSYQGKSSPSTYSGKSLQKSAVPQMARGGILTSPTHVIAGEAGAEAFVPLENTSFIDKFAYTVANAVSEILPNNNQPYQQNTAMYIDKDILVGVIKETLNNDTNNFGSNQFDFRIG